MFQGRRFPKLRLNPSTSGGNRIVNGTEQGSPVTDGSKKALSASKSLETGKNSSLLRRAASGGGGAISATNSSNLNPDKRTNNDKTYQGPGELAQFDACVEACDALAASGGQTVRSSGIMNEYSENEEFICSDCSVMVSPDGALLFLPKCGNGQSGSLRSGSSTSPSPTPTNKENEIPISTASTVNNASAHFMKSPTSAEASILATSAKDLSVVSASSSTPAMFFPGEEYESAIIMGNDLTPGGDRTVNGFTAKGWNTNSATIAIRRAENTLRATGSFVEELVLSRKAAAAHASQACDKLRDVMVTEDTRHRSRLQEKHWGGAARPFATPEYGVSAPTGHRVDSRASAGSMSSVELDSKHGSEGGNVKVPLRGSLSREPSSLITVEASAAEFTSPNEKSRAGPLLFPGSTLHGATVAMEQYHALMAEGDAHKWRVASSRMSSGNGDDIDVGLLPAIQLATRKAAERAAKRERALLNAQRKADEAQSILMSRKTEAAKRWKSVQEAEEEVQRRVEEITRDRSRERERKRRHEENVRQNAIATGQLESSVTQQEIWELVSKVTTEMDGMSFAPTGLPNAPSAGPIDKSLDSSADASNLPGSKPSSRPPSPTSIMASRTEVEGEVGLPYLRSHATAADDDVDDAAGALLNALSSLDTTRRSARIAAEACLLSTANAQAKSLRSLLEIERSSIEERLRCIDSLERKINAIDVRADLDQFIEHEKKQTSGGATRLGDDDDGGIASALAVLNCHSEGIGVGVGVAGTASMSDYSGWGAHCDDPYIVTRDEIEGAVEFLFETNPYLLDQSALNIVAEEEKRDVALQSLEESIKLLVDVVSDRTVRGRGYRASTCYALNNQRGIKTQMDSDLQFDGLCVVLDTLLTGCDREPADIANAKMCMMLAQSFYVAKFDDSDTADTDREKRIYPKVKLVNHPIWSDEDFWVQALFQCVSESLTQSGVMTNFEKTILGLEKGKVTTRRIKWYDLNCDERSEAASQVHAVIFAQLGALAHSMVEFGCDIEQACAFVRRLAIRHQLPLSHRTMLLQHLIERSKVVDVPRRPRKNSSSSTASELSRQDALVDAIAQIEFDAENVSTEFGAGHEFADGDNNTETDQDDVNDNLSIVNTIFADKLKATYF